MFANTNIALVVSVLQLLFGFAFPWFCFVFQVLGSHNHILRECQPSFETAVEKQLQVLYEYVKKDLLSKIRMGQTIWDFAIVLVLK